MPVGRCKRHVRGEFYETAADFGGRYLLLLLTLPPLSLLSFSLPLPVMLVSSALMLLFLFSLAKQAAILSMRSNDKTDSYVFFCVELS